MRSEHARPGMAVRIGNSYRIAERRGMPGRIVGCYGGGEYTAVDVRFDDGARQFFWPEDLDEISSPQRHWWRSLLGGTSAR